MTKFSNIHVLHIASGDLWAGAEVQLFTLVKALDKHPDIIVDVILLNHGPLEEKLKEHGMNVTVFDETQLNGLQILLQIIHIIKINRPDVIHTHRNKENILGSIAALVNGRKPSLRTVHGAAEHKPMWHQLIKSTVFFSDWFCARFLQRKMIAVSQDLSDILQKSFPAEKIAVIENGIDIEELTNLTQSPPTDTSASANFKVCLAGRLVPIKRVDIFIMTAQHLKNTHPDLAISFHIYGDGPLLDELMQLNKNAQTEDIIYFEGHNENLPTELQKMDALLMTSDHEGMPMILLEAMVLKTPIIAHAVGGIPSLLNYGKCGILVSENSAASFAKAICQLVDDQKITNTIIENALVRVKQYYSSDRNANAYCRQYRYLAKP
jgi:glycosyltransferase involved in cell wall biosynthesis